MLPAGLTAYKVAKGVGISQTHLGDILKERRGVTAEGGVKLSAFFKMSPALLVQFAERVRVPVCGREAGYPRDLARSVPELADPTAKIADVAE